MSYVDRLSDDACAIFLFHGVVERSDYAVRNYTRKHLPLAEFRDLIASLKAAGQPLSMDQVLHHSLTGAPFPKRSFAITFDDGFRNNLTVAAPVLTEMQVPATFYVSTDLVESKAMSWIDRIELCLEATPRGTVRLPWRADPWVFDSAEGRKDLLRDIRRVVKSDPSIDVPALISGIYRDCGLTEVFTSDDPLDQKLSWAEVGELAASPLFIVGGHSHTHPILSFLSPEKLAYELDTSLDLLARKAGVPADHYSYPEGLAHCYSPEVIAALKQRGVRCCPTAEDGVNPPGTDPFLLKRIMVG